MGIFHWDRNLITAPETPEKNSFYPRDGCLHHLSKIIFCTCFGVKLCQKSSSARSQVLCAMLGAAKCYRTRLYVIYYPNVQILVALFECKTKTIPYLYVGVLELFDMQKGGFQRMV